MARFLLSLSAKAYTTVNTVYMLIEYNNKENLQFVIIAGAVNLISMLYFVCGLFAFVKWTMLNTKLLISIRRPITNMRLYN